MLGEEAARTGALPTPGGDVGGAPSPPRCRLEASMTTSLELLMSFLVLRYSTMPWAAGRGTHPGSREEWMWLKPVGARGTMVLAHSPTLRAQSHRMSATINRLGSVGLAVAVAELPLKYLPRKELYPPMVVALGPWPT
jgi:hypothetical protein